MMELPEASALAEEMSRGLGGKVVTAGNQGNTHHKWAWYSASADEYASILPGKRVGDAFPLGSMSFLALEPGYYLGIGDGGTRVRLHEPGEKLPAKHHFAMSFEDGTSLSVAVQGWGAALLLPEGHDRLKPGPGRVNPVSDEFTYDRFKQMLDTDEKREKRSTKSFMASESLLLGIGNGYTQDILFRAKLHPRRPIGGLTGRERQRWYRAIRGVLREAIEAGGRDTEPGLLGQPGAYVPILDRRAKGQPCPECGQAIEKIAYLGGSCYVCPGCQPL